MAFPLRFRRRAAALLTVAACTALAACTPAQSDADADADPAAAHGNAVSIATLTETRFSAPERQNYAVRGERIETPSDPDARYYLLSHKALPFHGRAAATIRAERGGRIAYFRVEVDCAQRLLRVTGVGNRRAFAETGFGRHETLRPVGGEAPRADLVAHICRESDRKQQSVGQPRRPDRANPIERDDPLTNRSGTP